MSASTQSAHDDLAFMRQVVQPGDGWVRQFGETYFAAGACYGGQMLLSAAMMSGWLPSSPPWAMGIGVGPTVVFLVLLTWLLWRGRRNGPSGLVGKAIGAVFGCVGAANLVLAAVIAVVAVGQHSLTTWLIYPCAVLTLQGAAWMVVFALRRRIWLLAVALGWFATAVAMAFSVDQMGLYILWAGIGFVAFMVAPGLAMMRIAAKPA